MLVLFFAIVTVVIIFFPFHHFNKSSHMTKMLRNVIWGQWGHLHLPLPQGVPQSLQCVSMDDGKVSAGGLPWLIFITEILSRRFLMMQSCLGMQYNFSEHPVKHGEKAILKHLPCAVVE